MKALKRRGFIHHGSTLQGMLDFLWPAIKRDNAMRALHRTKQLSVAKLVGQHAPSARLTQTLNPKP